MAFGQASGPPAGARQVDHLAELLERAGFSSFREARHPYGLTQRQAAGKFTVGEAEELIERLEAAELVQQGEPQPEPEPPTPAVSPLPAEPAGAAPSAQRARKAQRKVEVMSAFTDDVLVAELERRGWCCIPPISSLEEEPG
jgi:hypothetical protein